MPVLGWAVMLPGNDIPVCVVRTVAEATDRAKALCCASRPNVMVVKLVETHLFKYRTSVEEIVHA